MKRFPIFWPMPGGIRPPSFDFFQPEDSQEFRRLFYRDLNARANLSLRSFGLVSAALIVAFGGLDHVLFPDVAWTLNIVRVAILPVVLGVVFFSLWRKADRHVLLAGTVLYQSIAVAIDFMVYFTGGVDSRYYAGNMLVLLAMYVFMPWRPTITILNGLAIYFLYLLIALLAEPGPFDWRILLNNSYFLLATVVIGSVWSFIGYDLLLRESRASFQLSAEKNRSETLLRSIMPERVARDLRANKSVQPVQYANVSVLFTDFVGFTRIASHMSPRDLIAELDSYFRSFDQVMAIYGLEKLKTIGDSYMCAGGIPVPKKTHAIDCVLAALDMLRITEEHMREKEAAGRESWAIRIGVHSGPVVAGITGTKKFAYDIWGDTVNTASRVESSAQVNTVNISEQTYDQIKSYFDCVDRGEIAAKGKDAIRMYTVDGLRPEYRDPDGTDPNLSFFRKYRAHLVYGPGVDGAHPGGGGA